MPIPSETLPEWASDTNFTNGPRPGTVTKIKPSDGVIAEGSVPGNRPPAQWFNWFWNLASLWIRWFIDRAVTVDDNGDTSIDGDYNYSDENGRTRKVFIPPWDSHKTGTWAKIGYSGNSLIPVGLNSGAAQSQLFVDLSWLPVGCTITKVSATVRPGTARATTSDRIRLDFIRLTGLPNLPAPGTLTPQVDDGGTSLQTIEITGINATINHESETAFIVLTSGNSVDADGINTFYVEYTVPGPR